MSHRNGDMHRPDTNTDTANLGPNQTEKLADAAEKKGALPRITHHVRSHSFEYAILLGSLIAVSGAAVKIKKDYDSIAQTALYKEQSAKMTAGTTNPNTPDEEMEKEIIRNKEEAKRLRESIPQIERQRYTEMERAVLYGHIFFQLAEKHRLVRFPDGGKDAYVEAEKQREILIRSTNPDPNKPILGDLTPFQKELLSYIEGYDPDFAAQIRKNWGIEN